MNPTSELDRVFPLSTGSSERARLKAPRLFPGIKATSGFVMGNRAFRRAWAGRRAAIAHALSSQPIAERGPSDRATFD